MKKSVFGILTTREAAEKVVDRLKAAGFTSNDISVLLPDTSGTHGFAYEHATKAPEGVTTGGTTGFVVGGVLGWLAGIGSLAIPGLGPFIAAGPIMAALSGAAVGSAIGGITGALIGMGIPEYEAKRYENRVKEGNILVSVHTENGDQIDRAKDILHMEGATDIATSSEAAFHEQQQQTATGVAQQTGSGTAPLQGSGGQSSSSSSTVGSARPTQPGPRDTIP